MDKVKKRERSMNFTHDETERLISLLECRKHIVENKKNDAVTWRQKEMVWEAIEFEFNRRGSGTFRNARHLKLKYEGLKRDIRKKCSIICSDPYNATPLTRVEQKIKEMILPTIKGDEIIQNSDHLVEPKEEKHDDTLAESKLDCIGSLVETNLGCDDSSETNMDCVNTLAEAKLDSILLQKQVIEEELEEKRLRNQILRDEMQHKKELYELEKTQMLLRIEILKRELDNKNKLYT